MEILLGLVVLGGLGYWFWKKSQSTVKVEEAVPYKVETPAAEEPKKCGCGRSPSGYCVGLHSLTAEEWAGHTDNPNKVLEKPAKKAKATAMKAKPKAEKAPKEAKPKAPKKPKTLKVAK